MNFCTIGAKKVLILQHLKRILQITTVLQKNLQDSFLRGLNSNDVAELLQSLRIYAAIDKINDAEDLYRKRIVAPYMESVSDSFMRNFYYVSYLSWMLTEM